VDRQRDAAIIVSKKIKPSFKPGVERTTSDPLLSEVDS
jgi:hypothetical protein